MLGLVPLLRAQHSIAAKDVAGVWILETAAGQPPASVNIKTWRIDFSADGKWTYAGEMTGQFGGVRVNGSGSWKIVSDALEYTAGDNKGSSKPTIKNGILTLSPDPVVTPGGKTPVVTTYRRGT